MSDIIKDDSKNDPNKALGNLSIFDNFLNLFSNNYHVFIVRKSERLASALYVITGFMPTEEPIRSRLRVCALEVITHSANPYDLAENGAKKFESRCAEIVTILQTAHYSGLISEMNAKLVGEEYVSLAAFVITNSSKISERGHLLEKVSVSEPKSVSSSIRHGDKATVSGSTKNKRTNTVKEKDSGSYRKNLILGLFDKKELISIKDAVSLMNGVSEKTIQRDILSLVSDGVLSKTGSRRWTTYRKVAKAQ